MLDGSENEARGYIIKPFRSVLSFNISFSYDIALAMSITALEAQQVSVHLYADVVANCILIYDHMSTLPEEITFIWCRPKAFSAILFFVNRYVALLANIFYLFSNFLPISNKRFVFQVLQYLLSCSTKASCSKYLLANQVLLVSQQVFICIVLFLRTYALYGVAGACLNGWQSSVSLL
ncbi:hypothetical protein BDR07DRAFT_308303 [Suillus spraguei]|nr:hypothetical protein BDR07DRAFT_308303 [Suillus spraguei]